MNHANKRKRGWNLALGMVVLGIAANTDAHTVVNAGYLPERPVIDGTPDGALWDGVPWQDGFRSIRNLAPARHDTRFKFGRDATHLFLLVRCDRPGIDREPPSTKAPGGNIWEDEGIELFLCPLGPKGPMYQAIVNAWGTPFTAQPRGPPWTPELEIGTTRDADGWTLELAVPFAAFDAEPPAADGVPDKVILERTLGAGAEVLAFRHQMTDARTGQPLAWGFNIGRNSGGHWSYSPFRGGFWQPDKFAALSFSETEPAAAWHWDAVFDSATEHLVRTDRFRFETVATYRHRSRQPRQAVLRTFFEGQETDASEWTADIAPGIQHPFTIAMPMPGTGSQTLRVELLERLPDGGMRRLRTDRLVREFQRLPIDIGFRFPYARDVLYASQPVAALQARVQLTERSALGRAISIELQAQDGEPVVTHEAVLDGLAQDIDLALPALEPGAYRLTAWSQPDGLTFFETLRPLRVLAPAAQEWIIGQDGLVRRQDTPFTARGMVSTTHERAGNKIEPDDLRRLAREHQINLHVALASRHLDIEALTALLDRHRDSGIVVLVSPFHGDADRATEPVDAAEEAALRARVRRLRDHDALMGYILAQWPSDRLAVRNRLQHIADIVWDEDPYRPIVSLHDSIPGYRALAGIADIRVMAPCLRLTDGIRRRPAGVADAFAGAAAVSSRARPAFWIGIGLPGREPSPATQALTANEQRILLDAGRGHGAGGFLVPLTDGPDGRPILSADAVSLLAPAGK